MSSDYPRLTARELKAWREARVIAKGFRCEACKLPMTQAQAVVDHCHTTGQLRGAIHRTCNSVIGAWENSAKRYGSPPERTRALSHGLAGYLYRPKKPVLYTTHRTPEEKRVLRNKRAAAKRARKSK